RPAFRYDREDSSADFDATFWTKSLISNGPSLSNSFSLAVSDNGRLTRRPGPLAFAPFPRLRLVGVIFSSGFFIRFSFALAERFLFQDEGSRFIVVMTAT